jgi:hypothetical protein
MYRRTTFQLDDVVPAVSEVIKITLPPKLGDLTH